MNQNPLQKNYLRINVNSNDINEVKRVIETSVNQLLNNLKILKYKVDLAYHLQRNL